ncbi:MAG: GTPase Era [Deltaproteobacteria bacterium]|nr:GTPase Era [Deltaproteobacteria bacterium]
MRSGVVRRRPSDKPGSTGRDDAGARPDHRNPGDAPRSRDPNQVPDRPQAPRYEPSATRKPRRQQAMTRSGVPQPVDPLKDPVVAAPPPAVPPAPPVVERAHEPDYSVGSWSEDPLSDAQVAARQDAVDAGEFRFGAAVLAGQPNAGKSTLLNRLLGEKLAIVSPKPQTTRDNIRGILTTAKAQVVFLDTPGIHKARTPLNRAMVGQAVEALETVDVVVLVVDAPKAARWAERAGTKPDLADAEAAAELDDSAEALDAVPTEAVVAEGETQAAPPAVELHRGIHPGDRRVIREILRHNRKWMIALNKTDIVKPRHLLPVMQALGTAPGVGPIVPISAWTADGVRSLVDEIIQYMPLGQPEFAADELTDRPLRFLAAELVREQVFLQTREEVPYGVACETEVWEELQDLTHIQVLVHVEKPAQRAILIGKQGQRMKALATAARKQMERQTGRKVFMEVHVRVEPNWPERIEKLRDFGYLT